MKCTCGEEIDDPYDVTMFGDDTMDKCCGHMDVPALIECEHCGQFWADGEPIEEPRNAY